jgi:hypothetical protein
MPIHSLPRGKNTLFTYDMDVGCNLCLFGASQPPPYNVIWARPYPKFPKIQPHLHNRKTVRVETYAHPQLIKVLKHFIYMWYGCGMQSTGVWSLSTTTLQHHSGWTIPQVSQNPPPPDQKCNTVRVDPYVHPQLSNWGCIDKKINK